MIQQNPMVKVGLPVSLFDRLKRAAELTHRSVEDVLASTVNAALPPDPALPAEVVDDLAALVLFSDDALWAAAESALSPAQQRRLEQLSTVADSRSLTGAESSELSHLLEQYDRSVLRRAKAFVSWFASAPPFSASTAVRRNGWRANAVTSITFSLIPRAVQRPLTISVWPVLPATAPSSTGRKLSIPAPAGSNRCSTPDGNAGKSTSPGVKTGRRSSA